MGLSARDVILPIVPMFHANAGGSPFPRPWSAAALVLPGAKLDGPSVYELLTTTRSPSPARVPTVWLLLLQYLEKTGASCPI